MLPVDAEFSAPDVVGVELAAELDDAAEDAGFELEAGAEDAGASLHPAIVMDKLMASVTARIRADFLLNRMINTSHIQKQAANQLP